MTDRQTTRTARDPWLDNAKMALVTLVVVGHAWALLPGGGWLGWFYDFLYFWHLPAFVFVTGYLSRTFDYTPARLWSLVRTVAVPYVVFEGLMALFRLYVGGERLEDLYTNPHWPMWFLAALVVWRLATPIFRAPPAAVALLVAVGLCLWSGTIDGNLADVFDLTRTVGLLPFFVLGVHTTPERLERLRARGASWAAGVAFVALGLLASRTDDIAGTEWLYWASPYADLGSSDLHGAVTRLALLGIAVAGTCAFLALVPRVSGWFSRMGAATLIVYLCHGFAVRGLEYAGYGEWAADHPVLAPPLTLVGAALLSLALAAPPVSRRLLLLVDPVGQAERQVKQAVELSFETARVPRRSAPVHAESPQPPRSGPR